MSVPSGVPHTVFAAGIDKVELKTAVADFALTLATFDKAAAGKDIALEARKLVREQLPAAARAAVPDNSVIVDLNAVVDGQKISRFVGALETSIPYTLQQGDDPEAITVFLVKEDGYVEPVVGIYKPAAGKVRLAGKARCLPFFLSSRRVYPMFRTLGYNYQCFPLGH